MTTNTSGLTQLGGDVRGFDSPEQAVLERVPNPNADTLYLARFTAPGVTVLAVNRPCRAGCMCDMFRLLVPAPGGKWSDFTGFPSGDEVLARIGRKDLEHVEYVLPETGTDIKVIDPDTRKTLLLIGWSGGRFRIK